VAGLMLEQWGYQVESVESGQQALRRLQETSYDLVLLDIQMPGMSGYKAFKMLRQQKEREGRRPVPVVALTAHCVVGERERALRAGMDGFLTKPVERAALSQTLARLFPEACPESTAQGVEPRL
jgi:CheY-like chemotaxis protein